MKIINLHKSNPYLFIGILSVMYFTCSGFNFSTIEVHTTAGASPFIVIPVSAYSLPVALTNPMTAALLQL